MYIIYMYAYLFIYYKRLCENRINLGFVDIFQIVANSQNDVIFTPVYKVLIYLLGVFLCALKNHNRNLYSST